MPNDKMNEFLRNRKIKNKQIASFRKQRIVKNYHKLEQNTEIAKQQQFAQQDEGTKRRLEFYQQVFSQAPQQKKQKKPKVEQPTQPVVDPHAAKMEKLKNKKKKFIKKMQMQRTKKGQPVMRNYVKYALAKLEETLEKEKGKKPK